MIEEKKILKPFLRWAGCKNWFTKKIENYLSKQFNNYYEPFVGGGSVFFYLKSKGLIQNKAYLSDSNPDLINTYKVIKNNREHLFSLLKDHINSEEVYYRMREMVFEEPMNQNFQLIKDF